MTEKLVRLLTVIYVPMMWSLVVIFALVGLIGILAPKRLRAMVGVFTRNRPNRAIGVVLIIVGAEMFIRGSVTVLPWLVKMVGVVLFVDGGVRLVLPTLSVIFAEWCVARSDYWYRVLGLVCFGLAYLFYHATRLPLAGIIEGVNFHHG